MIPRRTLGILLVLEAILTDFIERRSFISATKANLLICIP